MKLSKWIVIDGFCVTRVLQGTDPEAIENRRAFIEKTPRVFNGKEWVYGPKGTGGSGNAEEEQIYGFYPPSRAWCDEQLKTMGYTFDE